MIWMLRGWLGEDPEVTRFRLWAGVVVVWLVLGVASCERIRFEISGERATATLVPPKANRPVSHVTYRYQDAETGAFQKKVIKVRSRSQFLPSIDVLYMPGSKPAYSIPADRIRLPMFLFAGLTLAGLGAAGWMAFSGRR